MPVVKIELDERSQQILEAVVTCYIASGEPVGSRTISRKYSFGLSRPLSVTLWPTWRRWVSSCTRIPPPDGYPQNWATAFM